MGDVEGLERLLAEDTVLHTDGGGQVSAARHPIHGRHAVARFLSRVFANEARLHPEAPPILVRAWLNGTPGVLVHQGGSVDSAVQFQVRDGRVRAIHVQRNPQKLRHVQG